MTSRSSVMPASAETRSEGSNILSPVRRRTLEKLVGAARRLARDGGYAAVTMQTVAQQAGVSRITAYKYFSNKDHLLAAVVVAWSEEIIVDLDRDPSIATDPEMTLAGQVARRFERVFDALLAEPRLLVAVLASSASPAPEAVAATAEMLQVMPGYIGPVLNTLPASEQQWLARYTGYLFHAILLAAASGRIDRDQAVEDFGRALGGLFDIHPGGVSPDGINSLDSNR